MKVIEMVNAACCTLFMAREDGKISSRMLWLVVMVQFMQKKTISSDCLSVFVCATNSDVLFMDSFC